MSNKTIVGITGVATSGKDTLFLILNDLFKQYNINCQRFALGDILKSEINQFCQLNFGISSFTSNSKEKELIRPVMVETAKVKRTVSYGKHYTNIVTPHIEDSLKDNELPIITDIRFCEYAQDEFNWLKNKFNGILIHIERTLSDGQILPPANSEEEKNNYKLKDLSDYQLKWPTTEDKNIRIDCVKLQLNGFLERIINGKSN